MLHNTNILIACLTLLLVTLPSMAQDQRPGNPPAPPMGQGEPPDRQGRPPRLVSLSGLGRPQASLTIVATSPIDKDTASALAEDIPVMLQILRKNLDKGATPGFMPGLGPMELLGSGQAQFQGIYVQGHGLILLGNALIGQAQDLRQPPTRPDQARPVDPVWQQARQELWAGAIGSFGPPGSRPMGPTTPQGWNEQELFEQMIRTLRHASNIRGLAKGDLVTICITGQMATGQATAMLPEYGGPGTPLPVIPNTSIGPTFTVQAARADIELFASSQMSFEQFRQKVKQLKY